VSSIRWVPESVVLAVHDEQLAKYGGLPGIRDKTLLLSALDRPQNIAAYGTPDLACLAAAYAAGIVRNHPFFDGNKRTGLVIAAGIFLPLNSYVLGVENIEMVRTMLALADGTMTENELGLWFRTYMRPDQISL
jgi:death-on-curing protein